MPNKILFPSLSEDGWIDNSIKTADYLFSHFFLSDYSQSYIYSGKVASLPWILQKNQDNIQDATSEIQQTLSEYFSRYFNTVVVEVNEIPNLADPSSGQISIYINFTDSTGNSYNLGKMVKIANTKIEEIININNG